MSPRFNIHFTIITAGVLGTSIQIFLTFWARITGLTPVNPELIMGSLLTGTLSPSTYRIGILLHLLSAGFFALIYEWIFRRIDRSGWRAGISVGSGHWLIAAFLFAFFPIVGKLFPIYLSLGIFWTRGCFYNLFSCLSNI